MNIYAARWDRDSPLTLSGWRGNPKCYAIEKHFDVAGRERSIDIGDAENKEMANKN